VIANIAHELNNPLSGVIGYSQLLMAKDSLQPQDMRMLRQIHDSAARCHRTVQNLLSFGARHASEKRFLGVNGILEKVIDLKAYRLQADGISVDLELQPDLPRTMLDFHQMEQVFLNLLQNAHQALMDRPDGRRIVVRSRTADGVIRVEVIDNGPGMEPDVLPKVFDPFFTTRRPEEGIGLGLSIAYGIARDHGGSLHVASSPGLGATFTVEVPIVPSAEVAEESAPAEVEVMPAVRHREGPWILVVDDEPAILDLFIDILKRLPVRVDTAANGAEAIRKVQETSYDLVISDMIMPEMDGPTLYREISRRRPEMLRRLVFTTGDSVGTASSEFLERVQRPVIPKPIDIRRVMDVVRGATGMAAGAA